MAISEFVCVDKTGTLTNHMIKVKTLLLNGQLYKFSRKKLKSGNWK